MARPKFPCSLAKEGTPAARAIQDGVEQSAMSNLCALTRHAPVTAFAATAGALVPQAIQDTPAISRCFPVRIVVVLMALALTMVLNVVVTVDGQALVVRLRRRSVATIATTMEHV